MRRAIARLVAPLIGAALLAGCGLHPLYGSGGTTAALGGIDVPAIQGKSGWLVANALRDRLAAMKADGGASRYRLDVTLEDQITGLGVRPDNSVSRERRTLRARYQLVDLSSGTVVVDATAGSDAGIDVIRSEYATIAAENSALERLAAILADKMVSRLALYARQPVAPSAR